MPPPPIVMIPWVLSLGLEFWLLALLLRRQLFRELPVFSCVVFIYAVLDVVVFWASFVAFFAAGVFAMSWSRRLLVARISYSSSASRAGHPVWRRCSAFKYSRYSQSSRLASRAPRSEIRYSN